MQKVVYTLQFKVEKWSHSMESVAWENHFFLCTWFTQNV